MSKPTPTRVLFSRTLTGISHRVFVAFLALFIFTPVITAVYSITRAGTTTNSTAVAAAPATLNFQARLLNSNGAIVADGNYHVEFKLYNVSTAGTAEWTETRTTGNLVQVKAGYLSVNLGSVTAFPGTIDWTQQHWLTMNIGGNAGAASWDGEMTPRIQLTAVPYAFAAASASQLMTTSGANTATLSINAPTSGNQTFQIPDQGAAGTYNLLTSAAAAGSYVQLQGGTPGTAQTGNLNITGTGIFGTALQTGGVATAGVLKIADGTGQYATLQVADIAADRILTIPAATSADTFCLQTLGNCAGSAMTIGVLDSQTKSADGAVITGSSLVMQTADASSPGLVSTGSQTFGGAKTFNGSITMATTQTIRFIGDITTNRPAGAEGMLYYDTTTKQLLVYANGKWQADRSNSTVIVGTSAVGGTSGAVASVGYDGADAVNTSTTSAQTTIQTAINNLPATGGTVYLMEGTYIIDGAITPTRSNFTLVGSGRGTILKLKNGINANINLIDMTIGNGISGATYRNMTLDGNKANNTSGTQQGMYQWGTVASTPGVTIDGVIFQNFRNVGAYIYNTKNSNVSNSAFISNGDTGLYMQATTQSRVVNNNATSNTNYGMYLSADGGSATGNTLESNGTGMAIWGDSKGFTVTGNYIGSSASVGFSASPVNVTFSGNTVNGTTSGNGVVVSSNDIVTGNIISGAGANGIYMSGSVCNNTVSSNRIVNSGTGTASSSGIATTCAFNIITDNIISDTAGTGYAISITNFGNWPYQNYLSNNRYFGTGASSILDGGYHTIFVNQPDANGNIINKGNTATTIGTSTVNGTLSVQGGYTGAALATPAAPSVGTNGPTGTASYTYAITALDGTGETLASAGATIANGFTPLDGTHYNNITWSRIDGATSYKIYRTAVSGGGSPATTGLIGTVTASNANNGQTNSVTQTFSDTGLAASGSTPTSNTTGGGTFAGGLQGGSSLTLGTSSSISGTIVLKNSGGAFTVSVLSATQTGNFTATIPVLNANDTFCMATLANCPGSGAISVGALDGQAANANAATITGGVLYLQSASATNPGVVNTTTQTFAGAKTFNGSITMAATQTITFVGDITANRPAVPAEGMLFYDTTIKQLLVYANGKWQADRSTATKIVAMGTTTGCTGSTPVASQNPDGADYVSTSCTSAQTTINSAISALSAGGGTVYLMDGTYIIDGSITPNTKTRIVGAGPNTIIKLKDGINAAINAISMASKNEVVISDLTLDGNSANNTSGNQIGVNASTSGTATAAGVTVTNATIKSFRYYGTYFSSGRASKITNSQFVSNASGIYTNASPDGTISNNTFLSNTNIAVEMYSSNNIVSNNAMRANAVGIYVQGGADNMISGNVVSGSTSTTVGSIDLWSAGSHNTIIGNTITGGAYWGISLRSNTSHTLVTGNTIEGNTNAGLFTTGASNNVISNNKLYNNTASGTNSSIEITFNSDNNTIVGNTITDTAGTGYAILVNSATSASDQNYLSGNTFSGTGATAINDAGTNTIFVNQQDGNGNTLNKNSNALTIATSTVNGTLSVQGGYTGAALSTPAAPTITTAGTAGTTTYTYVVTAVDGTGETAASVAGSTTTGNANIDGTNYNIITWTKVAGATSYKIYRTVGSVSDPTTGLVGTVVVSGAGTTQAFNDTGLAASGSAPATNTTGGASFAGSIQGGSSLVLGTSSSINGTIVLKNSTNANTATIQSAAQTGNFTATLPVLTANDTFCLQSLANCADGGVTSIGVIDSQAKSANGAVITGTSLVMQTADASNPGLVSTGAQTFAGNKTFNGSVTLAATQTIRFIGDATANRPASPSDGTLFYDTTTKQLLVYNSSTAKWQSDRTDAIIVAASNSSQAEKDAADYVADGNTAAAGDGDQIQINSALSAAAGKKVVLLPGTYVADATILIPNNTTLTGIGNGTVIELADLDATDNLIENSDTATGAGIVISNLALSGRKDLNTAGTQNGIYLNNMGAGTGASARRGATVNNVRISGFRSQGIYLLASDNNTVSNSLLADNSGAGMVVYTGSDSNTINNVTATGNAYEGFWLNSASYNTFTGNVVQGAVNDAGYSLGAGSQYNTFSGNAAYGNYNGFSVDGLTSTHNTFTGNTSANNVGAGFKTSSTSYQTITGNEIYANGENGVMISSASYITLTGNTIRGNTLQGVYVYGFDNATYIARENNISNNTLQDNGAATTNDAVYLDGYAVKNIVSGNTINDSSATTNNYAININSANSSGNYLSNNLLSSGTIRDLGTSTVYANQLNASNVLLQRAAGGTSVQNTSGQSVLTTAATGATVTVGQSSAVAGQLSFANASNANTITLVTSVATANRTLTLPDETGTICTNAAGGACSALSFYIQNGTSLQASANFNIDGNGQAASFKAPAFDRATAGALTIGGTNATSVAVGNSATTALTVGSAAGNMQTTVNGSALFKSTTGNDSATAFQIQNSAGTSILTTDTLNQKLNVTVANKPLIFSFGGDNSDYFQSVKSTTDGGYVAAGLTYSYGAGAGDTLIAKYDKFNVLQWSKTWGGSGYDRGYDVVQTADGGYAVTGYTQSTGITSGGSDVFLLKYDSSGNLSWAKIWGGAGSDTADSLVQTSDGGYAVAGYTTTTGFTAGSNDMLVIKYDSTGTVTWAKTWGGTGNDQVSRIVQTSDGGYAIAGDTGSSGAGGYDIALVKLDSTGTATWAKTWGGTGYDYGKGLVQTSDGGYAVAGYTNSAGYVVGGNDAVLIKFDGTGALSWSRTWASPATGNEYAYDMVEAADGGLVIAGDAVGGFGNTYNPDATVVKFSSAGSLVWNSIYRALPQGEANYYSSEEYMGIAKRSTGDFILVGDAWSGTNEHQGDGLVANYSSTGTIANCDSTVCLNPTAIVGSPSVTLGTPTGTQNSPAGTVSSPAGTAGSVTPTTYNFVSDQGFSVSGDTLLNGRVLAKVTTDSDMAFQLQNAAGTGLVTLDTISSKLTASVAQGAQIHLWTALKSSSNAGDDFEDIARTADGGYIATGYTGADGTAGSGDVLLVKYRSNDTVEWSKTWGGSGWDYGYNVVVTSDGGYAVSGTTGSYGAGGNDLLLLKYDSSGNLSWAKTWGSTGYEYGGYLAQTSDGGYIMTGRTTTAGFTTGGNDIQLIKFDSSGAVTWSKSWGGTAEENPQSVIQTSDGGYAVTGYTTSYGGGSYDVVLVKFDSTGAVLWAKTWGGPSYDQAYQVIQTSDGGLAVAGQSCPVTSSACQDVLLKYTSAGVLSWAKNIGNAVDNAYASNLVQTSDGGYALLGTTDTYGDGNWGDEMVVKVDSTGTFVWATTFGGKVDEYLGGIIEATNGDLVTAGTTDSWDSYGNYNYDAYVVRRSSTGVITGCVAPICKTVTVPSTNGTGTETSPAGTLGTTTGTLNTPTTGTVVTVNNSDYVQQTSYGSEVQGSTKMTGNVLLRPATDSLVALRVENASHYPVMNVDTINKRLGVGTGTPSATLSVTASTEAQSILNVQDRNNVNALDLRYASASAPGLTAKWYNSTNGNHKTIGSGTLAYTGIDGPINWADLTTTRPAGVNSTYINVRWEGQVYAEFTETYTFYTRSDDGSRLSINGTQKVDNWYDQGATERSGTVNLVAGKWYDIVIDYYQGTAAGTMSASWSSPSIPKANIPLNRLRTYPTSLQLNVSAPTIIKPADGQNSTGAFQVQNASGTSVLNFDSVNNRLSVRAANDAAVVSTTDLFASSTFPASTAEWITNNPTAGSSATAQHVSGGGTTGISPTVAVAPVSGTSYQVTVTISGRTTGSIDLQFGSTGQSGLNANTTYTYVGRAQSASALIFYPTSDFNGTISGITFKPITDLAMSFQTTNTSGASKFELRTGNANTFLGWESGKVNTSGSANTAVGMWALQNNTSGGNNDVFGDSAMFKNNTGGYNAAFGSSALKSNISGSNNAALGNSALYGVVSGGKNTGIGVYSGYYAGDTSNNNTFLGYASGAWDSGFNFYQTSNLQNASAIGYSAIVQASNSMVLGSIDNVTKVGIGTTIPLNQFSVSPVLYTTLGTSVRASQSTTTVTATSGTPFTSAMVGAQIIFADGTSDTITGFTSSTVVTVATSRTVASQHFRVHAVGLQVATTGDTFVQNVSTTGFYVKNYTASILNADTSGLKVNIGSTSTDANAVLLTLDSYNNATDPTGVAGAMYYNTATNKFRCYENSAWKDCISGFNTVTKTSDQAATQSSTVYQNDNTLTFSVAANSSYVFDAWIPIDTSDATAVGKYTFTAPSGAVYNASTFNYSTATASTACNVLSSATNCVLASNAANFIQVRGFVRTSATAGSFTFQFAQNVGTAVSFPVVKAGATLSWHTTN